MRFNGAIVAVLIINPAELFGANIEVLEEEFKPLPKKGTEERYSNNFDNPMCFFKGAVIGFFFCLPFWVILFCLIN